MNKTKTNTSIYRCIAFILVYAVLLMSLVGCTSDEATQLLDNYGYSYTNSSVTTPNGSTVASRKYSGELTSTDYDYCVAYQEEYFPNVSVLRDPTLKYNCHSYAWYSTSPTNKHWIDYPSAYMTDGSYSYIASATSIVSIPSNVSNDSKVVWLKNNGSGYLPIHSGIKYSSTKIESKWGMMGLYRHSQSYSPYNDDTDAIWYYK